MAYFISMILLISYGVIYVNIIVQKFGGTSVSTSEKRSFAIKKILQCYEAGNKVVVVVSAMGRKGEAYATDTLRSLVLSDYPKCSLKLLDLLMSCGETISAVALAANLEALGYKTIPLMGFQAGIITNDNFSDARILSIHKEKILKYLDEGNIVVVTGFQGMTESEEITTLGRGGSDTTATALGAALGANCVEIYTDVNGIMSADPNIVPKAKIINEINYEEIFQMADKGAKVIHPRAVEIAQGCNIPIKIKNTLTEHPGTTIHSQHNLSHKISDLRNSLLTAITHKDGIVQITVTIEDQPERESRFLSSLTESNISIDMINFFVDKKVFTVEEKQLEELEKILNNLSIDYTALLGCSKVTIIGSRITGIPGVMATIVQTLGKEKIKILQSSDSHLTISCLIFQEYSKKAVNILHTAFSLDES